MKNTNDKPENLHSGHRERMRFRFERDIEMSSFNEHEILEYLLFYAIPRKDTNKLAHQIINHFGTFGDVFDASVDDLISVKGLTKSAALLIKSVQPIVRAIGISQRKGREVLSTSQDAIELFTNYFRNVRREMVYVACTDAQDRIINVVNIGTGLATTVTIDFHRLIQVVSTTNASKIILMHNHPSGNVQPSDNDILTTNYAMLSLYSFKVKLLDHIIFAPNGTYFSFFQNRIIDTLLENLNKLTATDVSSIYAGFTNKIKYYNKSVHLSDREREDLLNDISFTFDHEIDDSDGHGKA